MHRPKPLRLAFLPVLMVFAWPLSSAAQDVARMREIVQSYVDDQTFMGSVLVARGGEVVLSQGFGHADLEWGEPNTPTTKFRLGSVTKQFTAAAILLLAERGMLSVEDSVAKHVPDPPAAWSGVTIYHLLTHTSGIPNFTGFPDFNTFKRQPLSTEKAVGLFKDKPLEFAPGAQMRYSNSGYVLLGYIVERVSGKDYAAFLKENIFTPLGMNDSGYDVSADIIEHRARGYVRGPRGITNAPYVDMTIPHGAGGLYSTTQDLLRWTRALFGGQLLSSASLQSMITPFKNNYGMGVTVTVVNGRTVVAHSGGIEGFNTHLAYYPDERITIAVLANLNGNAPERIAAQLGTLAHGDAVVLTSERTEIELPAEVLTEYEGSYAITPTFVINMAVVGGALISQASGQAQVPLFAEAKDKFFARAVDAQIEFVRSADGDVNGLILRQGTVVARAARQ